MSDHAAPVLRPWSEDDLPLLSRLLGDPGMMRHLGGPETPDQIQARHRRYCEVDAGGIQRMLVIVAGADATAAGWVGFWERSHLGGTVWEAGWSVLPEFQGRGLAARAVALMLERARSEGVHRHLHAFPSVDNAASNAICRKVGFLLLGAVAHEYPPGHRMTCNDSRILLT